MNHESTETMKRRVNRTAALRDFCSAKPQHDCAQALYKSLLL